MAFNELSPLPFLPIPGKFDLTTYLPGSSDYEIMARVVETYNSAVKQFNEIISYYGDFDTTIKTLEENFTNQLKEYETKTDTKINQFTAQITAQQTTFEDGINIKMEQLQNTVQECYEEIEKIKNGDYIEVYVQALANWIDNNLQVMVSKVVKYVWFAINEDGYFVAYIPDKWDFIDFNTELDPDNEDYGKLALEWEPEVVQ